MIWELFVIKSKQFAWKNAGLCSHAFKMWPKYHEATPQENSKIYVGPLLLFKKSFP